VVNPATGVKHALRQVPVAAVTNPNAALLIAAGSEVDLIVLRGELDRLEADGIKARHRLYVDTHATIIEAEDYVTEADAKMTERIGSTSKGIGAARARRIMRTAKTAGQVAVMGKLADTGVWTTEGERELSGRGRYEHIQIEGAQGYGLGLHTEHYPQVTSSDCRAIDFLAMAGISPWATDNSIQVWVVYRPYPIRVAGNSGHLRGETTWEALGLEPEYTTVTKKMRRVGVWDTGLARRALTANGGPSPFVKIALTMADQLDPSIAGTTSPLVLQQSTPVYEFVRGIESELSSRVQLIGTSPSTVVDLR
jgi:adenylosuccinate synthase